MSMPTTCHDHARHRHQRTVHALSHVARPLQGAATAMMQCGLLGLASAFSPMYIQVGRGVG